MHPPPPPPPSSLPHQAGIVCLCNLSQSKIALRLADKPNFYIKNRRSKLEVPVLLIWEHICVQFSIILRARCYGHRIKKKKEMRRGLGRNRNDPKVEEDPLNVKGEVRARKGEVSFKARAKLIFLRSPTKNACIAG